MREPPEPVADQARGIIISLMLCSAINDVFSIIVNSLDCFSIMQWQASVKRQQRTGYGTLTQELYPKPLDYARNYSGAGGLIIPS